jgi:alanine dehydrogenase
MKDSTLLLSGRDIERLLDLRSCIDAVEDAFRRRAEGEPSPSGVLGVHAEGGGFHVKAAMLALGRPYFVAKVNANFPGNPERHGLPTIQGVLTLFDAERGVPLAIMDSMAITTLRTAAASGVAARHLARAGSKLVAIIGAGAQAPAHLAAFAEVLPVAHAFVYDLNHARAERLAAELGGRHGFAVEVARDLEHACAGRDLIATCTSASRAFLEPRHVAPGTLVAAVGADNEHKQELDPALVAASALVVDDVEQCATIGELHHAIVAGTGGRDDVRATLGEVVAKLKPGRARPDEVVVFDSTGVALQDVAAAAVVYERAVREGAGIAIQL